MPRPRARSARPCGCWRDRRQGARQRKHLPTYEKRRASRTRVAAIPAAPGLRLDVLVVGESVEVKRRPGRECELAVAVQEPGAGEVANGPIDRVGLRKGVGVI